MRICEIIYAKSMKRTIQNIRLGVNANIYCSSMLTYFQRDTKGYAKNTGRIRRVVCGHPHRDDTAIWFSIKIGTSNFHMHTTLSRLQPPAPECTAVLDKGIREEHRPHTKSSLWTSSSRRYGHLVLNKHWCIQSNFHIQTSQSRSQPPAPEFTAVLE